MQNFYAPYGVIKTFYAIIGFYYVLVLSLQTFDPIG